MTLWVLAIFVVAFTVLAYMMGRLVLECHLLAIERERTFLDEIEERMWED